MEIKDKPKRNRITHIVLIFSVLKKKGVYMSAIVIFYNISLSFCQFFCKAVTKNGLA